MRYFKKESQFQSDLVLFPELSISGYIEETELLDRVAIEDTSRILQKSWKHVFNTMLIR